MMDEIVMETVNEYQDEIISGNVKEYQVSWLTSFLHSLPHLDLTLQLVNSTFNLENVKYKESLIVWSSIPVLWLLVTLFLFLIYFCHRCCQPDVEKTRKVPCLRWSMAIFAFLACSSVGLGLFGNEEMNKGILHITEAADDSVYTITKLKDQTIELQRNINETLQMGIAGMRKVYDMHDELNSDLREQINVNTDKAFHFTQDILQNVYDINHKAARVDLSGFVRYTKEYGFYRWVVTLIELSCLLLLCLILLLGIGRSSKCLLLLFCAFGIFSLVLCWLSAGLYLLASVGVADFCVSPHSFFQGLASEQIEREIINYYIKCDINIISNPFKNPLRRATDDVKEANASLTKALNMAYNFINADDLQSSVQSVRAGLSKTVGNLMQLTALVECTNLHKDYVGTLEGICNMALPGIVYLLLSVGVTGFFFMILVILASRAWRHFGSKYSERQEETYYSRGRQGNSREPMAMRHCSTPPPAYNSECFRSYSDMNAPQDSRRSEYGIHESIA